MSDEDGSKSVTWYAFLTTTPVSNHFKPLRLRSPACSRQVLEININHHLDTGCLGSSPSQSRPLVVGTAAKSSRTAPLFSNRRSDLLPSSSPSLNAKRAAPDPTTSDLPAKRGKVSSNLKAAAPLAERLRPNCLAEFVGQSHLTGPDSLLTSTIKTGPVGSMILWGPPGCGKTTLARILAKQTGAIFKELSATDVGINEVRAVFEEAKGTLSVTGRKTILFLDEVHRFNKAQQDIFLPFVEQGHIQLIGATTENPSFRLTSALLSRCRVFVLERLTDDDIKQILTYAVDRVSPMEHGKMTSSEPSSSRSDPAPTPQSVHPSSPPASSPSLVQDSCPSFPQLTPRILAGIVSLSTGDARVALSLLDMVLRSSKDAQENTLLSSLRQSVSGSYDRTGDSHYDMISALHKSVRGSHGSAAMYWLARMLTAGEDPLYIARRMVVCASEDIGLADRHALPLAVATYQACQYVGMPECRINLAHLVGYLSEAPKSTRAYEAYKRAELAAKSDTTLPVPMSLRNAPTTLMKEIGYASGYLYNPDYAHPVCNQYLPAQFVGQLFLKKEGDKEGKLWDLSELQKWELEMNAGREWEGRQA